MHIHHMYNHINSAMYHISFLILCLSSRLSQTIARQGTKLDFSKYSDQLNTHVLDNYSLQGIVSEEEKNLLIPFCFSNPLVPSDQMDMLV